MCKYIPTHYTTFYLKEHTFNFCFRIYISTSAKIHKLNKVKSCKILSAIVTSLLRHKQNVDGKSVNIINIIILFNNISNNNFHED